MELPANTLWKIWTYAGPKAYFLDKELINIINKKRQEFIKEPLRIHYRLYRWKVRHYYNNPLAQVGRPTLCLEKAKYIDIDGLCSLGKINADNTLKISKQLSDKLIPVSTMRETTTGFKLTVLYWTIDTVWTTDWRTKFYSRLWPSWSLAPVESF